MNHNTHGRPSLQTGLPHGRDPATSAVQYSAEEVELLMALDRYKREKHRPFPTCIEILDIARSLGWRKVAPAGPLPVYAR